MNTVTDTILTKAEDISRMGLLDTLIDRVTRRIVPQTTAAANHCAGPYYLGSSCRLYPGSACNPPYGNYKFQYFYDAGDLSGPCFWACCH